MSLLQEALKRREDDEAQRKPEAGSAAKPPIALHPDNANLPAGSQTANDKNTIIPPERPPQSMPVPVPSQPAASQPALGTGGPNLAPRSAIALRAGESAEPSRPGGGSGEASVAQPWRRKISLLWVIVAAIAILTGLTVTAGFVFFVYRLLPPAKAKIGQQAYQIGETNTIAAFTLKHRNEGGTNIVIGQPMPAGKLETAASAETITHQPVVPDGKGVEKDSMVTAAPTQAVAGAQNTELNAVPPQSTGDTARKPVSAKPVFVRAKASKASVAVKWPALKLTGILRGSGPTESSALINGKIINAGQTIDNVTVVEIKADGVLLKQGAESRFLRVGATLY